MKRSIFAMAALAGLFAAAPAQAAPAANVEVCINDFRVQTGDARHSISGFGRVRDGRLFAYSISATEMAGIIGTTSITPTVAGPGTGYIAGQEPELVRFIERAAAEGAWIRVNLAASTGIVQKATYVGRVFPRPAGSCAA